MPTGEDTQKVVKAAPEDLAKATRTIEIGGPPAKRIYDQMSLVALVLDEELRIVRFNAAAERALGKRFDQVLGRPCFDALPDLSEIADCRACERAIAMGIPTEVKDVEIYDHARGKRFTFDFQIDPIVGDNGKLAGVSMIGLDVTERFKLRKRLARHNEDLKTLHAVSNALRKTMDLEKAFVIIASALTSEAGGGYDKALILVCDQDREHLLGRVAVDSLGLDTAEGIWRSLTTHDGPLDKMLESAFPVLHRRWGALTEKVKRVKVPLDSPDSLMIHALRTGEPVTHETCSEQGLEHLHLHLHPTLAEHFPMTCFAAAPLKTDQDAIGVVIVDSSSRPRRFSPERLNMLKMFASQSAVGDVLITSAPYDDPEHGPQVLHFPVPMQAEGVSVLNDWHALGMRGTGSHTVRLDGVFVPDAAVVLKRPRGAFHPFWNVILTVAMPYIMAVYTGIAEKAAATALGAARAPEIQTAYDQW
ncbi:MAG: PAS domain-containing protein, partial [Planctomycetaceae bacterium]|nr:PAS domain-containing protein [Planctomycetaceae bacterium]